MSDFFDIIFSFPTVIFSVATVVFVGFWTVTTLFGVGADALDGLDLDIDLDTDVDLDVDVDTDFDIGADAGLLASALNFMGLTRVPLLLGLSLLSLFAWLASALAIALLDSPSGVSGTVIGIAVSIGAFLVGVGATNVIGKRLEGVFKSGDSLTTCQITTSKVTGNFGQAEVRTEDGGSLIVQVRCSKPNELGAGDHALIFDLDNTDGIFQIAADRMPTP